MAGEQLLHRLSSCSTRASRRRSIRWSRRSARRSSTAKCGTETAQMPERRLKAACRASCRRASSKLFRPSATSAIPCARDSPPYSTQPCPSLDAKQVLAVAALGENLQKTPRSRTGLVPASGFLFFVFSVVRYFVEASILVAFLSVRVTLILVPALISPILASLPSMVTLTSLARS